MSQENVEIAKTSIEALAAGGVKAALSFVARDVVWYPFPEWVEESEYRGHDGFRRMAALYADNFAVGEKLGDGGEVDKGAPRRPA